MKTGCITFAYDGKITVPPVKDNDLSYIINCEDDAATIAKELTFYVEDLNLKKINSTALIYDALDTEMSKISEIVIAFALYLEHRKKKITLSYGEKRELFNCAETFKKAEELFNILDVEWVKI